MSRATPQFAGGILMLSSRRPKTIHALADDVILIIISFTEVKDILSLRQVSATLTRAPRRSVVTAPPCP